MFIVDVGFSNTKWMTEDNRFGKFTSAFRICKDEDSEEEDLEHRGVKYIIGDNALIKTNSRYLRFTDELVKFQDIFVLVACKKASISEKDLDALIIGLPYAFWAQESIARKKNRANAIDVIINNIKEIEEYSFKSVYVFPQGLGGIKAYLDTLREDEKDGKIIGIDIGFNTVISTLYDCKERKILYGETHYKKGVIDLVTNYLLHKIKKRIPERKMLPHEINAIFQSGYVQHGFDRYDIQPEIIEATDEYVEYLLDYISGDMKENFGQTDFHTAVFFGGGSRMIKKVNIQGIKVCLLPNPEYANVLGFKLRAEEMLRDS